MSEFERELQELLAAGKNIEAIKLCCCHSGLVLRLISPASTRDEHRAQTIGYEMADAADKSGVGGTFHVLSVSAIGAQVLALGVED